MKLTPIAYLIILKFKLKALISYIRYGRPALCCWHSTVDSRAGIKYVVSVLDSEHCIRCRRKAVKRLHLFLKRFGY